MRFDTILFAGFFVATSAHYTFNSLILNGQITAQFEYIRRHTQGIDPNRGADRALIASTNFRCNTGAAGSGPSTKVATVSPGQRIGFKSYYDKVEHPGPLMIYMSKAPGSVQNYDGSGDWFKVHEEITCGDLSNGLQDQDWCTWGRNEFFFTIPQQTPPGEYLVRVEHMAIHQSHIGNPEFYFSCAQIKVTGNGNGTPGPLVKIPGLYNLDDPAFNFNIYNRPANYPYRPGPPVWNGSGSGGSPSQPPPSNGGGSGCAAMYGQCGGRGFTGPTCCSAGKCNQLNEWYFQCT